MMPLAVAPCLTLDPTTKLRATIITVKGAKLEYHQRRVWTLAHLRLRVDIVVSQTGRASESWALFHAYTLLGSGDRCPTAELAEALDYLGIGSPLQTDLWASEWADMASLEAKTCVAEGRAWARELKEAR